MTIYKFPSHEDLETFAEEYLGVDYADFYEMYYHLDDDTEAELNELNQVKFEY